ncbi:hypothetical protein ACWEFJ_05005 [Actinosynnema sp. NPDC004786]
MAAGRGHERGARRPPDGNEWNPTKCWVRPDGVVVAGARDLDPATCAPAVAWR